MSRCLVWIIYHVMLIFWTIWSSPSVHRLFKSSKEKKFISNLKYYFWKDPIFYRQGEDQIIWRCALEEDKHRILEQCHSSTYMGHFCILETTTKILQSNVYWPSIFWHAYEFIKRFDRCQSTKNIFLIYGSLTFWGYFLHHSRISISYL